MIKDYWIQQILGTKEAGEKATAALETTTKSLPNIVAMAAAVAIVGAKLRNLLRNIWPQN